MKRSPFQQQVSSICRRHVFRAGVFFVGLMVVLAIGVSPVQAQKNYSVKNMGVLAGMKVCEPTAMSSTGQVVGTAKAGEDHVAFLYYYNGKEGEMDEVGSLGSRAFGISPGGIVVGDFYHPEQMTHFNHAAFFKGSEAVDLGTLAGYPYSRANGMNAFRQVVGFSSVLRDSDESRAFIWTSRTGMVDLGTLGGSHAQALAINDLGFVTGTSQVIMKGSRDESTHAFIYQPILDKETYQEPMRDLGTLGGDYSYGTAINANNHVVGYSSVYKSSPMVHAFYSDGDKTMLDIGALDKDGFIYSAALAINNADQVVGVSYRAPGDQKGINQAAFIWKRRPQVTPEMINLNTLVGTKAYWLLSAVAINDSGQIACTAYDYAQSTVVAVLLTPVK